MQLLFFIVCFTAQSLYAYDHIDSSSILTQEQEFLLKKEQLQQTIDNFYTKLEKLRDHPEFSNLQDISITTLFKIAEDHSTIFQNMTPSEFNAFHEELENRFQNQENENREDTITQFKQAIEFLQKTILTQYTVNELFAFGILYEFFYDYIYINQQMFNVNTQP